MSKTIALVDCNSFYCSCEKIFRPDLTARPVIVLSNNDGCAVALTKEAKELGIKRGVPLFQIKDIVDKNNVTVFSSNYALYGDISQRVFDTLKLFSANIENYSIDEAFLDLTGFNDVNKIALNIKNTVYKHVGVPVSVGIGESKTLAKLANFMAKRFPEYNNCFNIINHTDKEDIFKSIPVYEVWGIGYRYAKFLNKNNIFTVYDLVNRDDVWIKKNLTIKGLYTVWELRGKSVIEFETNVKDKKQIVSTRSFGNTVSEISHIKEAVSYHATIAGEKLRAQNSVCNRVGVIISTNRFKDEPQYSIIEFEKLVSPVCFTSDIVKTAFSIVDKVFKTGYSYKRCGVILTDITGNSNLQAELFEDRKLKDNKISLGKTIDTINQRFGKEKIHVGSFNQQKEWEMKRCFKSPDYTTRWKDLPLVR